MSAFLHSLNLQFGSIYYAINPTSYLYSIESSRPSNLNARMLGEYIHSGGHSNAHPDFTIIEIDWGTIAEEFRDYEAVVFAKRFNMGNIGNEAYVRFLLPHNWGGMSSSELIRYINQFFVAVSDVASPDSGDLIIIAEEAISVSADTDEYIRFKMPSAIPSFMPKPSMRVEEEAKKKPSRWKRNKRKHDELLVESDDDFAQEASANYVQEEDVITEIEKLELFKIESERQQALEELKQAVLNYVLTYHSDPSQVIQEHIRGKFIVAPDKLSPVVVNSNIDIVLPHYDELTVKMPALHKAIYILFLRHNAEGIVLKDFDNYRQELMNIYSVVKPGRDEQLAQTTINNLCNPLNNTLSEYISKINRQFRSVIKTKDIAEAYCIKGKRGEAYKTQLPQDHISLPSWAA